ncbi:MAG: hypothetical protein ABW194_01280 [Novosphingobium sp.]
MPLFEALLVATPDFAWSNRVAVPIEVNAYNSVRMPDTLTTAERGARMGRIRGRDTKPGLIVRRLLWSMGYSYRLQARDLPGQPASRFAVVGWPSWCTAASGIAIPTPACPLPVLPPV